MTDDSLTARQNFTGKIALAAMATGGNLPYRRLCREFGADLTCSEMIMADKLKRGSRSELPLLRSHESETSFGIQLCGKSPETMAEAALLALDAGCHWLDLNFGCPIDLVVRRGAGAAMLKKPAKLGRIVAAVRAVCPLPLSVKIRAGWSAKKINAVAVARICEGAGADAVMLHGRTREARYRYSADWDLINQVAETVSIPVVGNGDILTPWDLEQRLDGTAVSSVLVARGALIKPWIFTELHRRESIPYRIASRWQVMRRYCEFATEYFGDDEKGQIRVKRFFLWHLGFWHRYRPFNRADFEAALPAPLIQTRCDDPVGDDDCRLLASSDPDDHELIWRRVLDRDFPGE
ncbi:MAG: tRNA-dihydrouridine synthase family protein [bacterium]